MFDIKLQHLTSRNKGALLDTNLLVVSIVGTFGEGEVEKFKRTRQFTTEDVLGINDLIGGFGWTCSTPHVIAEASNLLDWLEDKKRLRAREFLAAYVQRVKELSISASDIVVTPVYLKLGITDAALCYLAREKNLVLVTVDLPLYHYAAGIGVEAINFNHLREQWLG